MPPAVCARWASQAGVGVTWGLWSQLARYRVEPQTRWESKNYLRAGYVRSERSVSSYEARQRHSSEYLCAVVFE